MLWKCCTHSICQQIWKTQQWPRDWKRSVFVPIPKKGNARECSNYHLWVPKNWCFRTVLLEKTLKNPLDCKDIKPVHPKGNLSWILTGRTDAEAETPILWPSDVKNWLIWKDPDAGKDWGQEEKGTTEDEMVGWHHCLDGHELEQAPGVGDGQGSLACCSIWCNKESEMTEWLNLTELICNQAGVFSSLV